MEKERKVKESKYAVGGHSLNRDFSVLFDRLNGVAT